MKDFKQKQWWLKMGRLNYSLARKARTPEVAAKCIERGKECFKKAYATPAAVQ